MEPVYKNAAQVQELYIRLFEGVQAADPHGMDSITKSKMVIRFRLKEPRVDMWVDGRSNPVQAHFGPQRIKASITASMAANTLHELLLGTLPLGQAIKKKRLSVKGSLFKLIKLEDLLHQCQARYPALAEEMLDQP